MSGVPFHQTRIGQRYYDVTLPDLVRQLAKLNGHLERLLALVELDADAPEPTPAEGKKDAEQR